MATNFIAVLLVTIISQVLSHPDVIIGGCSQAPVVPTNGYVEAGANNIGATRGVGCMAGYELEGPAVVTCASTGFWSLPGVCNYVNTGSGNGNDCQPDPQPPLYGYVEQGASYTGAMRRIGCVAGYEIAGQPFILCLNNGEWSLPGICKPESQGSAQECQDEPRAPDHGYVQAGVSVKGAVRAVGCFPGYKIVGQQYVSCGSDGKWSLPGTCISDNTGGGSECSSDPPTIENGFVEQGGNQMGDHRHVGCNSDYKMVGQSYVICLSSGQWTAPGQCEANQGVLASGGNTRYVNHSLVVWFITSLFVAFIFADK